MNINKLEPESLLKTKYIGKHYVFLESVDSTSTYLAAMDPEAAVHGTVVTADAQTAGRGRMQNTWHSPAGLNLYFSVLLKPDIVPAKTPQLALVTAVALMTALKSNFPDLHPGVKWPNDILVQDRKLAGILCEMRIEADKIHHVIIGAGINVNSRSETYPPELRGRAISLLDATGKKSSREQLIADILTELEKCYELWLEKGLPPFIEIIEGNSAINDREITVVTQNKEITGIARGLSDDGYLRLETPDGILQFPAGEVHLIRK
jgi:BirA family biotin operon repressor/biotin-[acetyl-CoA-carboxylase] ligase